MTCEHCEDPDGQPCFPSYGVAPHECFYKIPGATIGQSRLLPKEQWPDNFREDEENPGHGIYWCAYCGEGKPEDRTPAAPVPASTESAKPDGRVEDLAALVRKLVRALRKADPETTLGDGALGYLKRNGLKGSALRSEPVAGALTDEAKDAARWIDLKQQKPRDWQQVLVALDNGTVTVGMRGSMGWHWAETDAPEDAEATATHWKPWPAAPSPNSPVGGKD